MSEPITRADLDMLVATAIERVAKMTPAEREEMMESQRQSWVRGELGLSKTESASPSRLPGASAHPAKVGIESGPGQPTNIVAKINRSVAALRQIRTADMTAPEITAITNATDSLEKAAVEITRLRSERDALRFALDVARDSDKEAAQLIERGRRAGIEAAAQWHDDRAAAAEKRHYDGWAFDVADDRNSARAIRALADAQIAARKT